jgi:hypothetical protein
LPKTALVFMLLAWLIHKGFLRNAQEGLDQLKENRRGVEIEKKPSDFPERSYKTLLGAKLDKITDLTSIAEASKDATL